MKATSLLKTQHRAVLNLFKRLRSTAGAKPRRQLMDQVPEQLQSHSAIEEDIFYPAVRGLGSKKAQEIIAQAREEHHVVDLVISELPEVNPEGESFEAKMTVLWELVRHHAEEEEREMFKLAEKLGGRTLKELGDQMERATDTDVHHIGRRRRA